MSRYFAIAAITSLAIVCCSGCGEPGPALGTVKGQVTLDGKPLSKVAVAFMPAGTGGTTSAITDASGNYELSAVVGKCKVAVTTVNQAQVATNPEMSSDSPEYAKQAAGGGDNYNVKNVEPIPAKYHEQTELQYEVKSGSQVINLELKSS